MFLSWENWKKQILWWEIYKADTFLEKNDPKAGNLVHIQFLRYHKMTRIWTPSPLLLALVWF